MAERNSIAHTCATASALFIEYGTCNYGDPVTCFQVAQGTNSSLETQGDALSTVSDLDINRQCIPHQHCISSFSDGHSIVVSSSHELLGKQV